MLAWSFILVPLIPRNCKNKSKQYVKQSKQSKQKQTIRLIYQSTEQTKNPKFEVTLMAMRKMAD